MNYKNIIKSRKLRIFILSLLDWIPDKIMIPLQYKIHTGRKLDVKNPKRLSEKLQIYKLKYRNPLMLNCTDKYEVRKVIEKFGLKDLLIPLIGVYDNVSQIDYKTLPNKFVAKTTDGGGGNQVLVCSNKRELSEGEFIKTLEGWMKAPKGRNPGREWAYENNYPRRIIIEELLSDPTVSDLTDYKFFCFNGKVGFVYGISGRDLGIGAQVGVYTPEWKKLDVHRTDEYPALQTLPKPENYDQMLRISEVIGKHFPHVRIDLYNIQGKIYFGELTFYDGSGYMQYDPDSFDEEAGKMFDISSFHSTH